MVHIKLALDRFVGTDTADVGLEQQIFPFRSAAAREDTRNLCDQRLVIVESRLPGGEAAIDRQVRPPDRAAEGLPLILEQACEKPPAFATAVKTVQRIE